MIWARDLLFTKKQQKNTVGDIIAALQEAAHTNQCFNNPLYVAILGSEWHAQHLKTHEDVAEFVEAVKKALPLLYNIM